MNGTQTNSRGRALALVALTLGLGSASCQDVHAFVTGEKFFKAPKGSPRVEVELVVKVQDSFYQSLEVPGGTAELDRAIADRVLALADVGMRFYPILSSEYGKKAGRPEHIMLVTVEDLVVNTQNRMVEEKGAEPRIDSSVQSLDCTASTSVEKRRGEGPPLVVGASPGTGHSRVKSGSEGAETSTTYRLKRDSAEGPDLYVSKEDILASVEKAVVSGLREVVEAVDRDLGAEDAP